MEPIEAYAAPADAGAPVGPSAEEEAAFLAENPSVSPAPARVSATETAPSDDALEPLPPMDELVKRIPMPARDLLDELFRAKFVTVKRVPSSALK